MRIKGALRRQMFMRSMMLQSFWNFEGMQNIGFYYVFEPALRQIYADKEDFKNASFRYLNFFNTNPYTASFVIGAQAGIENDAARSPSKGALERADTLRRMMGSSFAAIGDALFWGALRPASVAVAAVVFAAVSWMGWGAPEAAAVIAFLFVFNAAALWSRWTGLFSGSEWGERIAVEMKKIRWQEKTRFIGRTGLVFAFVAVAAAAILPEWGSSDSWINILSLVIAMACLGRGVSILKLYAGAVAVGLVFGVVGG